MPEPSDQTGSGEWPRLDRHHVTAVLVTHDGERWLPQVLPAVHGQTRPWQRLAVADTASSDATRQLLAAWVGDDDIVELPRESGYGAAVKAAVTHADGRADPDADVATESIRWLWLLHDDAEPEPDALEQLLVAVDADPGLGVVGPKIRGWYDRRVLLEMGVSIDGGGRRETSLESGEQDQGQHDSRRETLAVSSAGMLVRRDVWETLGGFDPYLPLLRDDVDLCWRAWLAGSRVAVVPAAAMYHAEASARERRRIDAGSGRLHHLDRAGALRVLLANLATVAFALALPRLLVGSLMRTVGYLLAKVPRDAADELLAVGTVLIRPRAIMRMRRARQVTHQVPASSLRRLFPPPGHQFGVAREALAHAIGGRQVDREAIGRHRAAELAGDPGDLDLDLGAGGALARRLVRSPAVLLVGGLSVVSLIAERHLWTGGSLLGGAALPTPDSVGALWSRYAASWHPDGLGSPAAAPPYLGLLALVGTLMMGQIAFLTTFLLLAAVPLAGLCAYLAGAGLPTGRALRVWAAASYALAPVLTGAITAGRLGSAFVIALLPLLGRLAVSVVGSSRRPATPRSAWAAALLLAVLTAFVPLIWLLTLLPAVVVAVVGARDRALLRRLAIALGAPMVVLAPWSVHLLAHPNLFLVEPGPTGPGLSDRARNVWELLALNPGGPGSGPGWLGVGTVAAGLVGLAVAQDRLLPALAWGVGVVSLVIALVVSRISVTAASGGHPAAAWPGVAVAAAHAAILVAAAVGCRDVGRRMAVRDFGLVQPAAAAVAVAAVLAPLLVGAGWTWRGAQGPVHRGSAAVVPANVAAESLTSDRPRTLVLRSSGSGPNPVVLSYVLVRGAGPRLGAVDESVPAAAYARLRALVGDLVSGRGDAQAQRLTDFAVRYLEVRAPVVESVAAALDAVPGLERVNASGGDGLWRVTLPTARLAVVAPGGGGSVALPSGAVSATATILPGPPGRVLALAEPMDSHWRASLDGRRLPAVQRAGWAQGWTLPTTGGTLTVRHVDHLRGIACLAQASALLVLIVLALPGATRRAGEDDEPGPSIPPMRRHGHGDEMPSPDLPPPVASTAGRDGLR